jgi:enamine deaminase RidA (YjgF/YER057c/UK114 family)
MAGKRGLGLLTHGGAKMVFGKGAVAGGFVFLSGAEGRDPDTGVPVEGIRAQTEVAFEKIKSRLADAGATPEDVVKYVWFLKERETKEEFFAVRDAWLERNSPNLHNERSYGSTLLFVSGMSDERMLVEIDCVAYVGE